jgi:hypothetical protein
MASEQIRPFIRDPSLIRVRQSYHGISYEAANRHSPSDQHES